MKKINVWYFLLSFYFYFPFILKDIREINYIIIYLIPLIYIIFNAKFVLSFFRTLMKSHIKLSFISYFIVFCLSLIVPALYGTYDFSYNNVFLSIIRTLIKTLFLLIVFIKIHKNNDFVLFIKYFIYSCSLYVAFSLLMIIIPEFKSFWAGIIYDSALNIQLSMQDKYITRYGLVGFSNFRETFMCSLAAIFNVYIIVKNINTHTKNGTMIWTLLILGLGTSFYGRIGLVVYLISVGLLIFYLFFHKPRYFLLIVLSIAILLTVLISLKERNEMVNIWFNWSFDLFLNYFETGKLETGSSNTVFEKMIFMPDAMTFLFGDGYYSNPNGSGYYMSTDVGFMRPLLFYGFIPTMIAYGITYFLLFSILKVSLKRIDVAGIILSLLLFIQIVLFEIKGEMFYIMFPLLLPFAYMYFLENTSDYAKSNKT
ncbi:hypothetical protein [Bacillus kwashiorkori]|uniref:hypothetical protein n=1 Tax=Bacillus kwashiorkori TaxID=1522318 RepID=UPI001319C16D|nr:hypothetical protein [Bacillus kwashiorkori]